MLEADSAAHEATPTAVSPRKDATRDIGALSTGPRSHLTLLTIVSLLGLLGSRGHGLCLGLLSGLCGSSLGHCSRGGGLGGGRNRGGSFLFLRLFGRLRLWLFGGLRCLGGWYGCGSSSSYQNMVSICGPLGGGRGFHWKQPNLWRAHTSWGGSCCGGCLCRLSGSRVG